MEALIGLDVKDAVFADCSESYGFALSEMDDIVSVNSERNRLAKHFVLVNSIV